MKAFAAKENLSEYEFEVGKEEKIINLRLLMTYQAIG
jgi:hypothetical protein